MNSRSARWLVVLLFALASAWNYLDRTLIAAQAPRIRAEFHLSNQGYGWLASAFFLAYALASPLVGWFLDRDGLEIGISVAVGIWSLATLLTGFTNNFVQLVATRAVLGFWESAGVPAAGKLNAMYLPPEDRAVGAAITQVGISVGSTLAFALAARMGGWRDPFFLCGVLGLAWIPLWLLARRAVRPPFAVPAQTTASFQLLKDRRLVVLSVANMLWMLSYGLWTFWTTPYLVYRFGLTTQGAAAYAWFPPVAAVLGGFGGGWLSRSRIQRGSETIQARQWAILCSAVGCLSTLLVPLSPSPLVAVAAIGLSWFWSVAGSVNLYTIPVDIWGPERAGTAVSALVFSYGLAQTAVSPLIGTMVDRVGYGGVFWLVSLPPLAAYGLVRRGVRANLGVPYSA